MLANIFERYIWPLRMILDIGYWMSRFQEYDATVCYKSGHKYRDDGSLSCCPLAVSDNTLLSDEDVGTLTAFHISSFATGQLRDSQISQLIRNLHGSTPSLDKNRIRKTPFRVFHSVSILLSYDCSLCAVEYYNCIRAFDT